jgi:hypothetical protein
MNWCILRLRQSHLLGVADSGSAYAEWFLGRAFSMIHYLTFRLCTKQVGRITRRTGVGSRASPTGCDLEPLRNVCIVGPQHPFSRMLVPMAVNKVEVYQISSFFQRM